MLRDKVNIGAINAGYPPAVGGSAVFDGLAPP
jgi:hypothetical protein